MTLVTLPGIELTHQVNVVKSAIVELSVWHERWMLQLVSFICGIQVGLHFLAFHYHVYLLTQQSQYFYCRGNPPSTFGAGGEVRGVGWKQPY